MPPLPLPWGAPHPRDASRVPFIWDPSPSWSLLNLPVQSSRLSHDEPRVDFDRGGEALAKLSMSGWDPYPAPGAKVSKKTGATRGLTTLTYTIIPFRGQAWRQTQGLTPSLRGGFPSKRSPMNSRRSARRDRFQANGERAFFGFHWPSKTGRSRSLLAVGTASGERRPGQPDYHSISQKKWGRAWSNVGSEREAWSAAATRRAGSSSGERTIRGRLQ